MKTNETKDTQKIEVGKMSFTIVDEQPDIVPDDIRKNIEQELFKVFKKYESKDS